MDISIVIPVFNEADSIVPLYDQIERALIPIGREFEIILVDDGSTDNSLTRALSLMGLDATVRVVQLSRRFGQTAAMKAGIDQAQGSCVVLMDGDLQNDPADIPKLLAKLDEGYDLIAGWRIDRHDATWSRKLPSRIANWIIARLSGVAIHDTGCSLKAYRAELIRQLPLYAEMHRFIPALSTLAGARVAEVPVRHHRRRHGKSKYGLSRTGRVLLDLLTVKMLISSARRPMRWFGYWAIFPSALATVAGIAAVRNSMAGSDENSFVFPIVAFLFATLGINLLAAGLFGALLVQADPGEEIGPLVRHARKLISPHT